MRARRPEGRSGEACRRRVVHVKTCTAGTRIGGEGGSTGYFHAIPHLSHRRVSPENKIDSNSSWQDCCSLHLNADTDIPPCFQPHPSHCKTRRCRLDYSCSGPWVPGEGNRLGSAQRWHGWFGFGEEALSSVMYLPQVCRGLIPRSCE